jgi:hypothetical protein
VKKVMRYIDEVINTRKSFIKYCEDNQVKYKTSSFLKMLFLRYKYGISVNDFFNNKLYDNRISHREFFEKNSNTQKKWKYAHRTFMPDAGKSWLFTHRIDYAVSKLYCPGLNARDYFMYQFYRLSISAKRSFITDGMLKKMNYYFNGGTSSEKVEAHEILDNKLKFNRFFSDYVGRKWLYNREADLKTFNNTFGESEFVIVKPLDGDSGKGIYKAAAGNIENIEKLYKETRDGDFLIEEILVNDESIARIHPESLNTIRVNSILRNDGSVAVTGATIRIGVGKNVTDNFGTGGLAAEIDCESGIIYTRAVSWGTGVYYIHPETNQKIIGLTIPHWNKVVNLIHNAHKRLPAMRYIGWDVAVCPDGKIALIEANTHAGVALQQYPSLIGKRKVYEKFGKCF